MPPRRPPRPKAPRTSTEPASTEAESDATTTSSGGSATTTGSSGAATPAAGPGEHHVEDEGEPVKGGTLVYGIEADTANAWPPYRASYATSGYVPLDGGHRLPLPDHRRRRDRPDPRRVGRAQRRLHRVDAAHPRRHQVPRRHAARRGCGQVQHRCQPGCAADGWHADADRHRHRVRPGRRDHDQGRPMGRPPDLLRQRRVDRLHAVAEVAGQPARHAAAHRGRPGLRRRGGSDSRPTATR